jgi:hypothetical protein
MKIHGQSYKFSQLAEGDKFCLSSQDENNLREGYKKSSQEGWAEIVFAIPDRETRLGSKFEVSKDTEVIFLNRFSEIQD